MELTNVGLQTVPAGSVVTYDSVAVRPSCCMAYREGSGQITLKGARNGQRQFLVSFEANVALPAGSSPISPISLALSIDGEPLESTTMISSPAAAESFNNISVSTYISTPCGCCVTIACENTSGVPIDVRNASLLATRTA